MEKNICFKPDCTSPTKRHSSRFCSLLCANQYNASMRDADKKVYSKVCDCCGVPFDTGDRSRRFCNKSCAATYNNKKYQKRPPSDLWHVCTGCEARIYSKKYCSKTCRQSHEIDQWLAGSLTGNTAYGIATYVRIYLDKRSGGRCEGIDHRTGTRCTEDRAIQVDHIDGNSRDTSVHNVRHLCPTCHVLTPTYAGRNLGNGRTWKQSYNQYKKRDS